MKNKILEITMDDTTAKKCKNFILNAILEDENGMIYAVPVKIINSKDTVGVDPKELKETMNKLRILSKIDFKALKEFAKLIPQIENFQTAYETIIREEN